MFGGSNTAKAEVLHHKVTVTVDGKIVKLSRDPVIINNNNYVPLRGIFEQLGISIGWEQQSGTVKATKGAQTMEYRLGSSYAKINGADRYMPSPGKLIDGVVMVPLRFIGEAFGAELVWDPVTRAIQITSDEKLLTSISAEPTGNSGANLTNNAFVVKQGDWIYGLETIERPEETGHTFVSKGNSGFLYKVNQNSGEKIRLTSGTARMLNIQGDWLYFLDSYGICKIRLDGSEQTQLTLADDITQLIVMNNWALYNTSDGIYRLQLDRPGAFPIRVTNNPNIDQFTVSNGWIYYKEYRNGEQPGIIGKIGTNGSGNSIYGALDYEDLTVQGDYLYFTYLDESIGKIGRMPIEGGNLQNLQSASGYNISGNKLYYDVGPALYQSELDGSDSRKVASLGDWALPFRMILLDGSVYYEKGVFGSEAQFISAMYAVDLSSDTAYSLYGKILPEEYVPEYSLFAGAYESFLPTRDPKKEHETLQAAKAVIDQTLSPEMNTRDKVKALHDYVVLNTAYDYDNYLNGSIPEESYTEYGILILHTGVCQGYAVTMKMLLDLAGVENFYISGTNYAGAGHAWNIVVVDGEYYHLDATWDDPVPNMPGYIGDKYFLVTDEQMALDHIWDEERVKSFFVNP
ncbi:hypothetical protein AWJ19_29800 [Paenibacillus sp. DMB5]|nr:hypothetical protein AWJ19_29800 [Paenibacillus sp. DMB5]